MSEEKDFIPGSSDAAPRGRPENPHSAGRFDPARIVMVVGGHRSLTGSVAALLAHRIAVQAAKSSEAQSTEAAPKASPLGASEAKHREEQ